MLSIRSRVLISLLLLSGLILANNKTDELIPASLQMRLDSTTEDTSVVNVYNDIAVYFISRNKYKAQEYIDKSILLADKTNYKKGLADCYDIAGVIQHQKANYEEAKDFFNKAYELASELKWDDKRAAILSNRALLETDLFNYGKSLKLNLDALNIRKKTGDSLAIAISINNIGLNYYRLRDYKKAFLYYFNSYNIKTKLNNKYELANTANNIAQLYYELYSDTSLQYLDSAIAYQEQAILLWERTDNIPGTTKGLINLGILESEQKKYSEAFNSLQAAINYSKLMNDPASLSLAYYNMGLLAYNQGDFVSAIKYSLNSIEVANKISNTRLVVENAKLLAQCYGKQGDIKKAYDYSMIYINVNDSMLSSVNQSELNDILVKYDFILKQNVILEDAKQDVNNKNTKLLIGLIFILTILGSTALSLIYHQIKKKKQ
jgi:two-component system, NtrC family, sensor kinase